MSPARRSLYPASAVAWMLPGGHQRIVDLASGNGSFTRMLRGLGHHVVSVDANRAALVDLEQRSPSGTSICAQVENLPLRSQSMDVAATSETLHLFAPGLALAEIARVLRPGGRLVVAYNTRDDTVPWVRRFAALVQQADDEAMRGNFGTSSVGEVEQSPYFTDLEHRTFRNWVPITRPGLIQMVAARPAIAALDEDERAALLADVGGLYDSVARPPEPLSLPFQASCWRTRVDHTELRMPDEADGLSIVL